jgi:hypothetical protein
MEHDRTEDGLWPLLDMLANINEPSLAGVSLVMHLLLLEDSLS